MPLESDLGEYPESQYVLSAVIPISRMAGRLDNLESWIYKAAKSGKIQLILVHDIQDHGTKIELARIIEKVGYVNTQLLQGHFGNPGAARNHGSAHCKGNWVAYWDSDDIPLWENILVAISNAGDAEILIGEFNFLNSDKSIERLHLKENLIDSLIEYPGIWRMAFRNSLLERTRFPELLMGEDQVMLAGINIFAREIKEFNFEFYNYQVGNNHQLTKSKNAIQDIGQAIKFTWEISKEQENLNLILTKSLLCSQVITAFKKGTVTTRLSVVKFFISTRFKRGNRLSLGTIPIFLHVIRIKREKKLKCTSL